MTPDKKTLEEFIQHLIDSGKHKELEWANWDELIASFQAKQN